MFKIILSDLFKAGIPFLFMPFFIRSMPISDFSTYAIFASYCTVFNILVSFGGDAYYKQSLSEYNGRLFQCIIANNIFIFIFIFIFVLFFFETKGIYVYIYALISSLFIPIINLYITRWVFECKYNNVLKLQLSLSFASSFIPYMFIFVVSNGAWGNRVVPLIMCQCCFFLLLLISFKDKPVFDFNVSKKIIKAGLFTLPIYIYEPIKLLIEREIINRYLGEESLGMFFIISQFSIAFSFVILAINKYWLSQSLNDNKHSSLEYFLLTIGMYSLSLVAYPVAEFIVGDSYKLDTIIWFFLMSSSLLYGYTNYLAQRIIITGQGKGNVSHIFPMVFTVLYTVVLLSFSSRLSIYYIAIFGFLLNVVICISYFLNMRNLKAVMK